MHTEIQINQQLMQREDLLTEVFDLERQINAMLGGEPYPLAPPDGLPSRQKRKKPKRKAAPKKAAAVRLRKLDEQAEAAYRITYHENSVEKAELHTDPKPLTSLLNTPLPDIRIERVETVRATADGEWEAVEILYQSEPANSAES